MKRYLFKVLVLVIACLMTVTAFADEQIINGSGHVVQVYVEPDETSVFSAAPNGPSGMAPARPEDLEKANETLEDIFVSSENSYTRSTTHYLDNTYYVYNQTKDYYCGPACVQAVLRYVTGSTPSQGIVANALNTDAYKKSYSEDMRTYLNNAQSEHNYSTSYNSDATALRTRVYNAIVLRDVPLIIGLKFTQGVVWQYTTSGHAMTIYGVTEDKFTFHMGDPWIGYSGSGLSGSWTYPALSGAVHGAYQSLGAAVIY